jgi:hypothetical protein
MGATIRIPLRIEPGAQPLETFGVTLTNPRGGATLGACSSAEVRITDTRWRHGPSAASLAAH